MQKMEETEATESNIENFRDLWQNLFSLKLLTVSRIGKRLAFRS